MLQFSYQRQRWTGPDSDQADTPEPICVRRIDFLVLEITREVNSLHYLYSHLESLKTLDANTEDTPLPAKRHRS